MEKKFSPGCKLKTIIGQGTYLNGFELYVYDTKINMHKGLKKWFQVHNYKNESVGHDVCGMVVENHDLEKRIINDDEYHIFAAMFLCEEFLCTDIIAHECTHCAFVLERNIFRFVGLYNGDDDTGVAPEERLAYNIGDFTESIFKTCSKNKLKIKYFESK